MFQSTRPRGTRPPSGRNPMSCPRFNPRVRAGRDGNINSSGYIPVVSIHASARDATELIYRLCSAVRFNPRVRAGRDGQRRPGNRDRQAVSIHASARDATRSQSPSQRWALSFNPRVRAGRDAFGNGQRNTRIVFQSTRPRGTRRRSPSISSWPMVFQSTRPRGTRPRQDA